MIPYAFHTNALPAMAMHKYGTPRRVSAREPHENLKLSHEMQKRSLALLIFVRPRADAKAMTRDRPDSHVRCSSTLARFYAVFTDVKTILQLRRRMVLFASKLVIGAPSAACGEETFGVDDFRFKFIF